MFEKPPNSVEEGQEKVPIKEEVASVFKQLFESEDYETVRTREDDDGLYLWEVTSPSGGWYEYMRSGRYAEGQSTKTAIYGTSGEEVPYNVAEFVDVAWIKIS